MAKTKTRTLGVQKRIEAIMDRRNRTTATHDVRTTPKIHRNDPCICGSGKKYKKCCG